MTIQTDKMPPVPSLVEMTKPQGVKQSIVSPEWNRWFLQVAYKIDVVNDTVVQIGKVVGNGFAQRNPDGTWTTTTIVPVGSGGTGVNTLPSGEYLVGNGVGNVNTKTAAQVLSDIAAQPKFGSSSSSATGGSATALPAQPSGYVSVDVGGATKKIPYYD